MILSKKIMLILCFLSMLFTAQSAQASWEKLWDGPVGTVVIKSEGWLDDSPVLFATRQDTGDIYRYNPSNKNWQKIGGPAKKFIATREGLYGLSPDGQGIWSFTGRPEEWIQVGGPASAIYGGGLTLLATNPDTGDLYLYLGLPNEKWRKIGGPGKNFVVTDSIYEVRLSPDGNSVWMSSPEAPSPLVPTELINGHRWVQIRGPAKEIYSATNIYRLYATNAETGQISQYNRTTKEWDKIGGSGKMFAADDSGNLYGLSDDGSIIWKYMGVPEDWEQIGGPAGEIYAGGRDLYITSPVMRKLFHYIP